MLLTKEVDVTWNAANKKWYVDMGYLYTKMGYKFICKAEDLNPKGNAVVSVSCDYCDVKFTKKYMHYTDGRKIIKKDCCNNTECMKIKREEVMLAKYGFSNPNKLDSVINKREETNIIKYGFKNPNQNKEIHQKVVNTIKEKYGVDNISKSKEFQQKKLDKMYKNGTAPCSTQQKYLHNLLGGELNYPINRYLGDIVFIEDKIIVEYDGSGHNLGVVLGNITEKDFKNKEIKRNIILTKDGWKIIRLISKTDKLPSKERIKIMVDYAKQYLNEGHSWINFYMDYRIVKCSQYLKLYSMGNLTKVSL